MEMLKQLNEAKACGLTKEEFFHLLDQEVKLNESKKQVPDSPVNFSAASSELVNHEKLVQDICNKMEKQQEEQHKLLQQSIRDLFEQHKQQLQLQFHNLEQHLQHQQELHLQHIQTQFQQLENLQVHQKNEQHKNYSQEQVQQMRASERNFEQAVQDLKDKFHEMRNTVLNRLEEEKVFMRDALSKAQDDILSRLSQNEENVKKVKEIVEKEVLQGLERQIRLLLQLCEENLQTQQKTKVLQENKTKNSKVEVGRHNMFDPHISGEFDSPF